MSLQLFGFLKNSTRLTVNAPARLKAHDNDLSDQLNNNGMQNFMVACLVFDTMGRISRTVSRT